MRSIWRELRAELLDTSDIDRMEDLMEKMEEAACAFDQVSSHAMVPSMQKQQQQQQQPPPPQYSSSYQPPTYQQPAQSFDRNRPESSFSSTSNYYDSVPTDHVQQSSYSDYNNESRQFGDVINDYNYQPAPVQPTLPALSHVDVSHLSRSSTLPATDPGSAAYWNNDKMESARIASKVRKKLFGHVEWRQNQLGIINATMAGRDVFVLMPTGGGKSLTYQLPGCCSNGLTVVISPLLSLITDQIEALEAIDVRSMQISGSVSERDRNMFYDEVFRARRGDVMTIKFLFLTPEMVSASQKIHRAFAHLANAGLLERFVIDEAHCIRYAPCDNFFSFFCLLFFITHFSLYSSVNGAMTFVPIISA